MSAKKISTALTAAVVLTLLSPAVSFANSTPTPSPSALTQVQKAAIAAANTAFASAKVSAQEGFDRAIADAKALRDQAITDAGTDKAAIKIAQKNFRDFKKTIALALQSALKAAKLARQNALAAAHVRTSTK